MKQKCLNNNCLRTVTERGLCKKCTDLLNGGVRKRKAAKPIKLIKKESSRNYSKALREAKRSFQLLRRIQEADENGMVKCVGGQIRHYTKVDSGHFSPAKNLNTCFESMNVHPQAKIENMQMDDPIIMGKYTDFMIKKYGHEEVERLKIRSRLFRKYTVFELIEMKKNYDNEIAKIKSLRGWK